MHKTYFLGAPSPEGFDTRFTDEINSPENYTYIIKGGPGTGKSSFMKRLANDLSDIDEAELYFCSSDPDSLDAVIFRRLGVIFVDGTAPHVFEPKYPGARQQILDFSGFWQDNALKANAAEIVKLFDKNAEWHARAKRYLSAIHGLGEDMTAIGEAALYREKLMGYADRLSKKLFPKTGRAPGKISVKQITSITPKGMMTREEAFGGCRRFMIDDRLFAVTDCLLKALSVRASAAGYDVTVSKNVRLPGCRYEHIVIPELGISFSQGADGSYDKKINAMRFYDVETIRNFRRRLGFSSALRRDLTAAAVDSLAEAKAVHDKLERIYIDGMDFGKVDKLAEEIEERMRSQI